MLSLRNTIKNRSEKNISYINFGKSENPLWSIISDKHDKNYEIVGCELNEKMLPNLEKLRKSRFIDDSIKKYEINFEKIKKISELKVRVNFLLRSKERVFYWRKLRA